MTVAPGTRGGVAVGTLVGRLRRSTIVWSWGFNALRLAAGLIILPLVLWKLSKPDVGMYYLLLSLSALVPLVDFGFGPTIGRFVSYAMAGTESLQAYGVVPPAVQSGPNYRLLWQLLFTTRVLYRYLTLAVVVLLGVYGTYAVYVVVGQTSNPSLTWAAWALTFAAAVFDIYANWWGVYLRSMDQVLATTQFAVLGTILRVVLAAALLLSGFGLLSLPAGSLVSSAVQRFLTRRKCLKLLPPQPADTRADLKGVLALMWPNTWRLGVQFFSGYLTYNANNLICADVLGLDASSGYGLTVQLIDIASGMAAVWTAVKWPLLSQCRARHDNSTTQRILWPRVWLQNLSFIAMAGAVVLAGPWSLAHFGHGKHLLSQPWLALLALNSFCLLQFNLWGTLISLENRLPYLWPTVATNVASLLISLGLIHLTNLGVGALVLGPLIAGCAFNYWYWPPYAAKGIGTSLFHFLFASRPQRARTQY